MALPLTAHRVATQRVIGRPFPDAHQALVGRQRELANLSAALGAEGSVPPLLVTGPAGIGKSRLVQEALSLPTLAVIRVNCTATGGAFFHIPSTLIRLALELPGLPSASALEEALREAAPRLLPDDPHAAAFLGLLMGLPLPDRYEGLDPRSVRLSAFAACRGLLGAFREDDQQAGPASRPMVLLVEDLQWADAGSVEFLEHLTRVPLPPRTALVATSRPAAYPDGKPGRGDAWRQLPLEPLLPSDARELLRALAGGRSLPEMVEQAILEQAEGVPLALDEEFLAMVEEGRLVAERLHWEFKGGPEELVVGRARPFVEDERDVLAAIAVLSEDATEPLLEEVLGRPVADPLGRLVARGVLQRWVGPWAWSPVKFSFRHPTDQELALAALPEVSRLALHRHGCERNERLLDGSRTGPALARALWHSRESGLLAAAAPLAERLGDLARTAGLAAAAADAFTDAIALRQEGITSPLDVDAKEWHARGLDLMMKRAEANVLLGRMEEVTRDVAAVRVGFSEIGDKKRLCRAKLLLSRAFERAGDLARMEEEASEAARIAMEAGDEEFVARAQGAVAEAYERRARYEEALTHAEEARRRFEGLAAVMPPAVLKGALAAVYLTIARTHADRGATAEGLAAVEKAIPFARAASAATLPLALELHARLLRDSGDLAHALLTHEEALSIAESRSDRIAAASLWMSLGHLRRLAGPACWEAGDAAGALGAFKGALTACREMGDRAGSAAALANVGHLAHDQGDLGEASEAFREAVAIRGAIQDRVGGLTARLAWAEVEADRGLIAEAEARLSEAFAVAAEMGARVAEARGLLVAGRLRRHEGRHEEAATLHARARELAVAAGASREAHEAAVEEGYDALARGDVEGAARALGEAPVRAPWRGAREGAVEEAPVRAPLGQAPVRAPLDARARVRHMWLEAGLRLALGQESLPLAEEALTLAHRAGLRRLVPHALEVCAKAAESANDLAAAEAFRSRAAVLNRQLGAGR